MLGKTHFVLGMASALAITHPQTVPGVITAMTGGALGGWIVDVDLKNRDIARDEDAARENIYDAIIDGLFLLAFISADFFIGKGMCSYVIENWGIKIWGALFGIIILILIGLNTKHRTFTHSFLSMALFTGLVYLFCQPATIPFLIGYISHLFADFFNKLGLQLFFPLKWRPCLKLCRSDESPNKILFWISLAVDIVLGAFLFSKGMANVDLSSSLLITKITEKHLFGLNILQIYLILINLLTFLTFQRSYRAFYYEGINTDASPETRFEAWLRDLLVFLGGGIGMFISLVIHLQYPVAYNGNWWAFCYTSILFWFTVYCYICNPFGYSINNITWFSFKHIPLLTYLIGINVISALLLFTLRKRKFKENDIKHTIIFLIGALGGTAGAIPMVFFTNREGKYSYIVIGFFLMLLSQIVFIMYMLSAGVF